MPLCADCEEIETERRGAPGRSALKEMSYAQQNWGTGAVITTKFTCQVRGAKWEYENDKHDKGAGWSLG